ncbi:hypothetical protein Tco_1471090 [Tanacetum coccineum]
MEEWKELYAIILEKEFEKIRKNEGMFDENVNHEVKKDRAAYWEFSACAPPQFVEVLKMSVYSNMEVIKAKWLRTLKDEKVGVPKAKGRASQITTEETKVTPDVVTSIFLVRSIPTYILFYSGASMSFVSYGFSERISTLINKLLKPLEIADSKVIVVSNVYLDNELEIGD